MSLNPAETGEVYLETTLCNMKKIITGLVSNFYSVAFLYARLEMGRIMWLGMAGGGQASTQVSAQ